ncbi:Mor transcription activator family protein [Anaerovirgula multivorans]|uniref:Mor transcription activator family protein n=1 Tax=Anaerovirgula multivorans TaxID=312168 RepID=A0A239KM44_9FIRM|nr:Mor transcription activator family protein [Anaerovirgula multivorans]SNT19221.1 Mor transcription activator family protein [Anaerovirgula multivorans]
MDRFGPEHLNGIYKDIANDLGVEMALLIFNHYRGLQITFLTRLLCTEYVRKQVSIEYNGSNIKELSLKYSYSERWIRKMITQKLNK